MVKAIRQSDKETPILFLTAKTTVDDVVTGFNLGADDYLKKPFAIPELVVRMRALLERSGKRNLDQEKDQESYSIGDYQFTPESATLLHKPTGESAVIPRREADILRLAASVERSSEHPLADAIVRAANERNLTFT